MKVAVLKEMAGEERRVSASPETVRKLLALGVSDVAVEAGAGRSAAIGDTAFADAGSTLGERQDVISGADVVLAVQGPEPASLSGVKPGAWLVAGLNPLVERQRIDGYAALGVDAIAMDLMPRITRAQSMDILSSQSNLAGYKAVLDAAAEYGRVFPMMMTAAGTVTAARVFVMGVGVAGLQAIATARRLGAVVSATDVRPAVREQIESLGAKPVFVEDEEAQGAESAGGYATEMSDAYKVRQAALVSDHIGRQDIVITTALIPGRPAPRLISDAQLASMRPGSVIVDLAVESGGNVEGSVPGAIVERHGIKIVGHRNVPSRLAADASALFARNLYNFLAAYWNVEAGRPILPPEDEVTQAILLTSGGRVIHPRLLA